MKCFPDGRVCKRRPELVAVIFGRDVVVRGLDKNLTLDGSLSYDPETEDNKGMNFAWHYKKITRENKASLFVLRRNSSSPFFSLGSGRLITINSTSLVNCNETIIVRLSVTKDYRVSSVFQVVHLVLRDPPNISQR